MGLELVLTVPRSNGDNVDDEKMVNDIMLIFE
jgi:hypothetical protein